MSETLERSVVWKSLLIDGTDYCVLRHRSKAWLLRGTVIGVLKDQRPILVQYEVQCDENWSTREVQIQSSMGSETKTMSLTVYAPGRWRSSGQDVPQFSGCSDVDLSVTPATNTLPIRRLNLPIGSAASVTAAWIKFPDLTLQPLSQRYARLDKQTFHYESESGFSTDIVVDELGLVTKYPGGWERIASLDL